jgi:hypothetical protein
MRAGRGFRGSGCCPRVIPYRPVMRRRVAVWVAVTPPAGVREALWRRASSDLAAFRPSRHSRRTPGANGSAVPLQVLGGAPTPLRRDRVAVLLVISPGNEGPVREPLPARLSPLPELADGPRHTPSHHAQRNADMSCERFVAPTGPLFVQTDRKPRLAATAAARISLAPVSHEE